MSDTRIFCFCGRLPYAHIHDTQNGCPEPRVSFLDLPKRDVDDETIDREIKEIYGDD